MNREKTSWTFLYNSLYFISGKYEDVKELETPISEPFNELDTAIICGFDESQLDFFINNEWINLDLKIELIKFRDFVSKIDNSLWNPHDFDHSEDWNLARDWANSLMLKIGIKRDGWKNNTKVIYTK